MKIDVNGITLAYDVVGEGAPLIMLHGNGETHDIFYEAAEVLKNRFTCYLIDSRAHGESSPVDRLHYQDMADDIKCFIDALSLTDVTLYGFSDGGIIGLLVASQSEKIKNLIISGANTNTKDDISLRWQLFFKWLYFLHKDDKIRLMLEEPDIKNEELWKISANTLVLAGEKDIIREPHTRNIAKNIKGSVLKILPDEDHGSYIKHSTKIADIILDFCEN